MDVYREVTWDPLENYREVALDPLQGYREVAWDPLHSYKEFRRDRGYLLSPPLKIIMCPFRGAGGGGD